MVKTEIKPQKLPIYKGKNYVFNFQENFQNAISATTAKRS